MNWDSTFKWSFLHLILFAVFYIISLYGNAGAYYIATSASERNVTTDLFTTTAVVASIWMVFAVSYIFMFLGLIMTWFGGIFMINPTVTNDLKNWLKAWVNKP